MPLTVVVRFGEEKERKQSLKINLVICLTNYQLTNTLSIDSKKALNSPLLFVFGKDISSKLVYVKLKIKGNQQRHVLCVSFHYAKEKMTFPYA